MGAIKKDITLSDGQTVTLDISELRRKDWIRFWDGMDGENEIIKRYSSLTDEQMDNMLDKDFRMLVQEFITLRNKPLESPNSQSAST